jgi:hypothetical protein
MDSNPSEEDLIREAMRAIGSRRSERKTASSRANGAKAKAIVQTEEHKAKLREAQQSRREREKAEREAQGILPPPKRPQGRPKKKTDTEESTAHV